MGNEPISLSTRFTQLLGIKHPVMQEGLGPYKTVHLAAAVTNAGGLGTVSIPAISEEPAAGAADDIVFQALYGPSRALPSDAIAERAEIERSGAMNETELTAFKDARLIAAQRDGDMLGGILLAGQISGAISDLIHGAEFIRGIVNEAVAVLDRLSGYKTI